jgi:hypothetical protein
MELNQEIKRKKWDQGTLNNVEAGIKKLQPQE